MQLIKQYFLEDTVDKAEKEAFIKDWLNNLKRQQHCIAVMSQYTDIVYNSEGTRKWQERSQTSYHGSQIIHIMMYYALLNMEEP